MVLTMKQAIRIGLASLLLACMFAASQRPDAAAKPDQDDDSIASCSWGIVGCPSAFWTVSHSTNYACSTDCGDVEFPTRAAAMSYCNAHCDDECASVGGYTECPM